MNDVSFIFEGLKLNVKAGPFSTNLLLILKSQPFNRTGIHGIQIIFAETKVSRNRKRNLVS